MNKPKTPKPRPRKPLNHTAATDLASERLRRSAAFDQPQPSAPVPVAPPSWWQRFMDWIRW